jgi:aspartate-semialdehyde dehydrogenase
LRAHSEALHVVFDRPVDPTDAESLLAAAPGVTLDPDPQPINAAGGDDVLVGRVRRDAGVEEARGLALFVCGDQLRKGAALNAVQIGDRLMAVGGSS